MLVNKIRSALTELVAEEKVLVLDQVGSTMEEVKQFQTALSKDSFLGVVVALSQTAGRGRQGREWISNPNSGVYLSAIFRFKVVNLSSLGLFPLLVGLELKQRLEGFSNNLKLKWPNDLVVQTKDGVKKLGGLLLEATSEADIATVVIGVGLNIRKVLLPNSISLEELGKNANGNEHAQVSALVLSSTFAAVNTLQSASKSEFVARYNSQMLFLNQQVTFIEGAGVTLSGVNRGIDIDGSLLLETSSGTIKLYSGEVHQGI